jgi:hypothetical protein
MRLPALISLFTVLFFIFSLTGNVLIASPTFSNVAFAQKGKNKSKDKDKDQDKNKLKGNKRLRAAVSELQNRVEDLETAPPVPGAKGDKGDKGDQGDPGADSIVPGPKGDKGDKGNPGLASTVPGPRGEQGIQGIPGPQGDPGADSFVVGPKGDKGDKGDPGQDGAGGGVGYVLHDANGNYIGDIMGFDMESSNFRYLTHLRYTKAGGGILNVALNFDWFGEIRNVDSGFGESNLMYFSGRNCTGTPYILTNSDHNRKSKFGSHFPDTVAIRHDGIVNGQQTQPYAEPRIELYVADTNQTPQFVNTQSSISIGSCKNKGLGNYFIPAENLGNLLTIFPPPFNVVPVQ